MARIFILWEESFSVGIKKIDTQHKKLIDILNMLYESFVDQTTGQILDEIIKELADYTNYHFKTEEELFEEFNYPHKEEHIQEHNTFVQRIKDFETDLKMGKKGLTFQLMNYLKNWLISHIRGSDQVYVSYFRGKGL